MESIVFWGFNLHAWITIATVLTMFTILLFTKLRADLVFMGAVGILFVTGVLDAKEAFSGFSSGSVVVIGVLFVVVAGLTYTGILQWIVKHLLGQPNSYGKAVVRLMLPVAALSSFLSNTTVVTLFVSIVKMWSKKLDISPSKLLIPLSYASGMGGVCTLIGTPPNLIISGLYAEQTGVAMNVLATTIPGLFCLAVGVLSIIAMRRLLPDRKAPECGAEGQGFPYIVHPMEAMSIVATMTNDQELLAAAGTPRHVCLQGVRAAYQRSVWTLNIEHLTLKTYELST